MSKTFPFLSRLHHLGSPLLPLALEFLLYALFTLNFAFWVAIHLALDDLEIGRAHRIPLWLFGFLY